VNLVRSVRYLLWIKTWVLHLIKLWFSSNLSKFTRLLGRRNEITEVFNQSAINNQTKIAVIAMYPVKDKIYEVSMRNLISGLRENGIHVVLLLNRSASESLQHLFIEMNCTVIKRRNVGRDFGAYKDGVTWLETEIGLAKIERLFLINDTLMWLNSGTRIIARTLTPDWSSLFLNLEIHTHAQSFFLSFSNNVLKNEQFIKFWKKYIPTKHRRLTILNGEIKLSEVLIKQGFRCNAVVNPSIFKSSLIEEQMNDDVYSLLGSLALSEMSGMTPPGVKPGRKLPAEEVQGFSNPNKIIKEDALDHAQFRHLLSRVLNQYCNSHAPHRIGLHLYVVLGIPLKTDIYKCYTLSEIQSCVDLKNPEYADDVMDFLSGKSQQFMEGSRANVKRRKLGEI
jgi:hypothetical protein